MKKPDMKKPAEAPAPPPAPKRLFDESAPAAAAAPPTPAAIAAAAPVYVAPKDAVGGGVTIEYQRARAKEVRKYFQDLALTDKLVEAQCVTGGVLWV